MMRDVFYYGQKPNVHPKEKPAKNLADARKQATTEHFWIINEFCDYRNFDWDFDFDFLPDHEVWTENHINVWPSIHQKDSGTWLCPKKFSDVVVYRCDVDKVIRKKNISSNWKILENIDITRWDFSWHPDPTDPPYIYKWGCKFFPVELKSCIEYHVEGATNIKYMSDIVELLPNWELIKTYHKIDYSKFDMSWRPSPLDPPMIYVWGNKFVDGKTAPTLEYHVPGATEKKYLPELITLLPHKEKFEHLENSDGIDYTWVPNPASPPYIYAWGNQWNKPEDKVSIQYVVEGATEYKYMDERAVRKPCLDNWIIPDNIDTTGFDFSWEPSPADPPYIYQFGTQWQKTNGPRYVVADATEIKYIDIQKAKALPTTKNWTIPNNLDITGFDFSWHPDETSPPYIYHFATQWALTGGPIYTCEGATEVKYLEEPSAIALPDRTNWEFDPKLIDVDSFDFSWHPYVEDQPYVYVFGTQHQKTGGPRYITPGVLPTSPVKYIDTRIIKATRLANKKKFSILNNYKIKDFDYSWHPDETEEPYIYVFGNNQYSAEIMPTIEYAMPGAKQIKYVNDIVATLDIDMQNWKVPKGVDTTGFDFSWKPNPKDPAYIYQFGTQHQKTGGPRYTVPGATEVKYIDTQKVKHLSNKKKFTVLDNLVITDFDYSWHPDETEQPYIYVFGNNQYSAEIMPTIEYRMSGATQIKYVNQIVATLGIDKKNWTVPKNIDVSDFDFSWKPNPKDPPLIYQFGTQHQKTGGPRYSVKGATNVKYIDHKSLALPDKKKFKVLNKLIISDFDYSWHPDETDAPYIYIFGNNQYPPEIMPTIEYAMKDATQIKYVHNIKATLGVDKKNWTVPKNIDVSDFDFSWKPNPTDPPYIYEFGTQWQKTGGPKYIVEGATETKYVTTQQAKALPTKDKWVIPSNIDITGFDFSWHPDNTSPPYTYHFATQWALTGGPIYKMEGATEVKYMEHPSAIALPCLDNWEIPKEIDKSSFDFSWHPYVEDQPYVYVFGTQHQKTGGPRYITPGVIPTSPVKYIDTRIIKATRIKDKKKFSILNNYKIKEFDWSWHPDETDEPYVYVFGNNQYPAEIMPTIEYAMPGAKQIKYVSDVVAILDVDMSNWVVPADVDTTDFDFSWKPNPKDPAYIYEFGTQWQKNGGPKYVVPGATEVKYVSTQQAKALPTKDNWTVPSHVDVTNFDFSWHPDNTSPPYIYHFATQWALTGGPIYKINGATEVKYVEYPSAIALSNKENWEIPDDIDIGGFDFSWHPYVEDQPYVYVFGTQHQKTGGPKYITPGVIPTSPVKYIDTRILKATKLPNKKKFAILNNYKIKDFDYSWHPDETEQPYIYVFGNNQYSAEIMPTIEYAMPGAKQVKYVNEINATLDVDMKNWEIPAGIDASNFDFSWKPNPKDPAYIYQFGTQHQKTGGPRYVIEGATEVKYVDSIKVKALPDESKFNVLNNYKIKDFDYSWHPDETEEPYIYVFGNNQYSAEIMPTIEYRMEGATKIKYINSVSATLDIDMTNWVIPSDIEVVECDYSWKPNPKDPAYIYEFGTQHQKTGGLKYVVDGATEIKYIEKRFNAIRLPNKKKFAILNNYKIKEFDWSWHPDETEEPYIYVFGNNQYPAEIMPTIEYAMPGGKQVKYVSSIVAVLDTDMSNWEIPSNVDTTGFDFSWKPNPKDPAYIYEFGTQWQKTGGPRYVVEGATEIKYVTTQQVKALPTKDNWSIPSHVDVTNFDFSWHPDATSPPYIYHFATQWALTGGPIYTVEGATEKKYLEEPNAVALPNKENWEVPFDVDTTDFDFSWHPYIEDQPYIYQFGTQHQKTGGPRYITPGVIPTSPVKYIDTRILKAKKLSNKRNFAILNNYKIKEFDYSWHPDETDEPYIYVFGNNQYPAEIMPTIEYAMPGAKQIKYVQTVIAVLDTDMSNWEIPKNVDTTGFDFSWKPNPKDPAYIYEFGTQWQKTGGPRYVVQGATETKYVSTHKTKALPTKENWEIPAYIDVTDFDFSWHPDATSPPYIYHFATQWALSGGPIYRVKGATEVKYMEEPCARALPNKQNWEVPVDVDSKEFDFSWHPYVEDQPYVYVFGTQHQKTGGPKYITPGVIPTSPVKYIDTRILKAKKLPNRNNFAILNNYKIKDFDWSWHPDETEEPFIYVFGNSQYPAEIMPTIEYRMPGAKQVKYVSDKIAVLDDDRTNWIIPENIDVTNFDFSWKPNPKDPAYIYEFGTQWQKTGGPRYVVEDAAQVKYIEGSKAKSLPNKRNWILPKDIPIVEFDYSWHPDSTEDAYIYVFGTQWQLTAGPKYVVEGATEYKYMDVNFAKAGVTEKNWEVPTDIVLNSFDFSWHPHPDDPMFIYQFGTQWHDRGGPRYVSPGANKDTPVKYIDTRISKATLGPNKNNWEIPSNLDTTGFDFSWVPHPDDPPYIYQFGTQWQKTGGPKYTTSGAKDIKYVDTLKAKRLPSKSNWFNPFKVDTKKFDYSWHPDDTSPPYIYQFGTVLNRDDGPRYITPNSKGEIIYLPTVETEEQLVEEVVIQPTTTEVLVNKYFIETTLEDLVNQHPNEVFWAMNKNIDYTKFDFEWRPQIINVEWESAYVHVFGSTDSTATHTYFVNAKSYLSGNKDFKFVDTIQLTETELSKLFIKPDMFFVDRGNKESQSRFEKLKEKHGNIQKTRFLNSWVDTINRCINRSSTELCWILNSELDYTNFDFSYYPNPWQMKMVHVFGTQWNHWGTTFMVNRETFANDTKYIKVIEHLNNLNFVKDRIATANSVVHDIIYIDHGNFDEATVTTIKNEGKLVVKYDNDYLTTFKTILSKLPEKKEHFVWIVSSVCEYDKFDFTYICDPYAREQLHVFPSDRQKFGDTFFVNVNRLRELVNNMQSLKDYDKINYNQALRTSRLPAPLIVNEFDSHVMGVMQEFDFPYATFVTSDNKDIVAMDEEPMSLWDQESKTVLITSTGGTRIVVPKEAKQYVETQLYDYPYIKTASRLAKSNPLDIVYLSNGEKCAEENYEHLVKITKGLPNRLVRVDGVNGRVQAYHAAAEASNTSWFLTVFAKLKVNAKFDFNWQPDRLQIPKHYMFLARNPVNGLIYGHQGLIAYNKQMTLENDGQGLDFTLDSPHETIELLSGIATFNTDEFSTWRTAFREAIKLKKENSEISLKRLEAWTTKAEGDFAQYSLSGAKDGVAYYDKVKGKLDKLRLSYEWDWLQKEFTKKYKKKA